MPIVSLLLLFNNLPIKEAEASQINTHQPRAGRPVIFSVQEYWANFGGQRLPQPSRLLPRQEQAMAFPDDPAFVVWRSRMAMNCRSPHRLRSLSASASENQQGIVRSMWVSASRDGTTFRDLHSPLNLCLHVHDERQRSRRNSAFLDADFACQCAMAPIKSPKWSQSSSSRQQLARTELWWLSVERLDHDLRGISQKRRGTIGPAA